MGTWNPLIMLVGILVYLAPDAVVISTGLKITFLVLGGIGCYLLRSFVQYPASAGPRSRGSGTA